MKATQNAMPLTRSQVTALGAASARELVWGLRSVSREVAGWRARAAAIPDPARRGLALDALSRKRGHTDGAACFWTLLDRRSFPLLRTLVAYEVLLDYLDGVSEQDVSAEGATRRDVFRVASYALDLERTLSLSDPHLAAADDGGYLLALVSACRAGCRLLPSYEVVCPFLRREATRAMVLGLNHEPDPRLRTAQLQAWAATELRDLHDMPWFELTAAASGWLMTHVLLALAGAPAVRRADVEEVYAAYFPWIGLAVTMLDSYVDQEEDAQSAAHSYVGYYSDPKAAVARLRESISCAAHDVLALPHGERHAVLLACMIALYLSKDSARAPDLRDTTAHIAAAGGALTRLLLPILRAWRLCNAQSSAT